MPNPDPDHSNLSDAAKQEYMEKAPDLATRKGGQPMTGRQAFVEWVNRQEGGGAGAKDAPPSKDAPPAAKPAAPGGGDELGAGIDDLVQTNIEYFDQRYCDDLGAFWEQVKKNDKAVDLTESDSLKQFVRSADPDEAAGGQGLGRRGPRLHLQPQGQGIHRRHADGQHLPPQRQAGARGPVGRPADGHGARAVGGNAARRRAARQALRQGRLPGQDQPRGPVQRLSTQTSDTNSFNIVGQSVLDSLVKSGGEQGANRHGFHARRFRRPGGSMPPAGDAAARGGGSPAPAPAAP